METTHTAPITEFDDDAARGIAYNDDLTPAFIANYLARTVEDHLRESMKAAMTSILFDEVNGGPRRRPVELSDGIIYTVSASTAAVPLDGLHIRGVDGTATFDLEAGTVTVEISA